MAKKRKVFKKRFENRIEFAFAKHPVRPAEERYRNAALKNAIVQIFKGLLGREPTYEEITGNADILKNRVVRRQMNKT